MKKKKKAFCFCWSLQNKYNTKKCHFLLAETMGGEKNHTHQKLWTKDTKGGGDCRHLIERKKEWHLLLQKEKL